MLDVHAPHEKTHTWIDFFIHIATIVVGLLIAVGLEQAVEAIHHRHERDDLRESMQHESEQVLRDATSTAAAQDYSLNIISARIQNVKDAAWTQKPLASPAPYKLPLFAYPDDPIWRSAKTSGGAALLTPDEINGYSEIELICEKVSIFYDHWREAESKRFQFEKELPVLPNGQPDFSVVKPEDLHIYLSLLMSESSASLVFRTWNRDLIGAENTLLSGNFKLVDIFAAEKKAQGQLDLP